MSSYLLFVLLGLGAGAVYSLLALGLVMEFRSSGVVNFAHGAIAMYVAYVFVRLRDNGELVLPVVGLPHAVHIASGGVPTGIALVVALAYAAVIGLVVCHVVFRPLRHAPALAKVGASVGIMLVLQAIAALNFGTETVTTGPLLPTGTASVAGVGVPVNRFYLAGLAVICGVLLGLLYRRTRFGLATRAAAENDKGAALLGISPNWIATKNWVLATVLAGLAGILILPVTNLDPGSYTLYIVPALGVALLARFTSFAVTVVAGLGLGMLQSVVLKLVSDVSWLPRQGLEDGLPFLVIVVVMALSSRAMPARGEVSGHNPSIGRPRRPVLTGVVWLAIGAIALVSLQGVYRSGLISSIVWICIGLSLVLLTGYVGQVSLVQMGFAGVGGFALAHLASGGVPFPLSLLAAGLAAAALGVVIGLPAVRIRGVSLAVVTLASATALSSLVFNSSWFGGGFAGLSVGPPRLFGVDLGIAGSSPHEYPRVAFGLLALFVTVVMAVFVGRLRGAATGRVLIAVRSNERAAAAVGVDVARAKLAAFALSAFIAGIGGSLLAYQQSNLVPASFDAFQSLSILALVYVGGIARISGAVVAGLLLAPAGLLAAVLGSAIDFGAYQSLIGGVGLVLMAVAHPDGLASTEAAAKGIGDMVGRVRRLAGAATPQERLAAGGER